MNEQKREALKKLTFLYKPYSALKTSYVVKRRIRAVHSEGYAMTGDICSALEKRGISVFCAFGTLLGIIRDQDFVKTDSDLDFGILAAPDFSWETLEEALAELGLRKDHQYTAQGQILEQTYRKGYLSIDFFLYEAAGDELVAQVTFRDETAHYDDENEYSIMYRFAPPIPAIKALSFHGARVLIPENAEAYAERVYGPGWRVPDPGYDYKKERNVAKDKTARYESFGKS